MKTIWIAIVSISVLCSLAWAQTDEQKSGNAFYFRQYPVSSVTTADGPQVAVTVRGGMANAKAGAVWIEMADFSQPVTGAPYTATATTETRQTLGDGNHIVNKTITVLARDSQGRTRRDETMARVGPWAVQGGMLSFIHDPVAGADYVLNAKEQTAQVVRHGKAPTPAVIGKKALPGAAMIVARSGSGPEPQETMPFNILDSQTDGEVKTESLGTQTIEGVSAEGKRVTRTIAAGQIGNERPIETTSEVWFSPDLQMTILSKRSDPRFGDTVYQLTDIKRGEPDPSLFEVPAGYRTVIEEMQGPSLPPLPPVPPMPPVPSAPPSGTP
jgi:hypothetical protein